MMDWIATVLGVVAVSMAGSSLFVAVRSSKEAARSGEAALRGAEAARATASVVSRESAMRTRPWIAISSIEFSEGQNARLFPDGVLTVKYHNTGSLPAHSLDLDLTLQPSNDQALDCDKAPVTGKCDLGGVLPNEASDRHIPLPTAPRYRVWKQQKLKIAFVGCIQYKSGMTEYRTCFEGHLSFEAGRCNPRYLGQHRDDLSLEVLRRTLKPPLPRSESLFTRRLPFHPLLIHIRYVTYVYGQ